MWRNTKVMGRTGVRDTSKSVGHTIQERGSDRYYWQIWGALSGGAEMNTSSRTSPLAICSYVKQWPAEATNQVDRNLWVLEYFPTTTGYGEWILPLLSPFSTPAALNWEWEDLRATSHHLPTQAEMTCAAIENKG